MVLKYGFTVFALKKKINCERKIIEEKNQILALSSEDETGFLDLVGIPFAGTYQNFVRSLNRLSKETNF